MLFVRYEVSIHSIPFGMLQQQMRQAALQENAWLAKFVKKQKNQKQDAPEPGQVPAAASAPPPDNGAGSGPEGAASCQDGADSGPEAGDAEPDSSPDSNDSDLHGERFTKPKRSRDDTETDIDKDKTKPKKAKTTKAKAAEASIAIHGT